MPILKNAKHEKYIQELIKGKSQRQAYYIAFPNSKKWKKETVDSKASTLLRTDKVSERYKELQKKSETKAILTRQQRMQLLSEMATGIYEEETIIGIDEEGKQTRVKIPIKTAEKIKAIDTLNKMDGDYTSNLNVVSDVTVTLEEKRQLALEEIHKKLKDDE